MFAWFSDALCDYVSGKTIQQCFDLYFQLKDAVFDDRRPHDFDKLEAFLKQNFGVETVMSQLANPPQLPNPRVMVTGVLADRSPAELHLFRNYMYNNPMGARNRGPPFQPLLPPTGVLTFTLQCLHYKSTLWLCGLFWSFIFQDQ